MGRRECFSVLVTLPVVVCSAGFVRPGNQAVRLWGWNGVTYPRTTLQRGGAGRIVTPEVSEVKPESGATGLRAPRT